MMIKEFLAALVLATVAALFTPSFANACSCLPPDLARSYNSSDDVIAIKILRVPKPLKRLVPAGDVTYRGRVERVLKGCLVQGDRVLIQSARDSAACGMSLRRGGTYLLTAQRVETNESKLPILRINSCGYNVRLNALTQRDWEFLETRLNCCADRCICNDGSQPVNCFVDPCEVSSCDVPNVQCIPNYCGGCNAEWYDDTGAQVCKGECVDDADCSAEFWCRPDEQGIKECVPFVGPGERCEGFVLPFARERCAEGLVCVPLEETGDLPGICASCNVDGVPYQAGESFPAGDGCNTCTCMENGLVACTKIACSPFCEYGGNIYKPGDTFPADDGCNKCQCLGDGTVACTEMACLPFCEYGGKRYEPGVSFPADDGCNICVCQPDGRVICTMRACIQQP